MVLIESAKSGRFLLGRQSSLKPRDEETSSHATTTTTTSDADLPEDWDNTLQLLFLTNKGDLQGIASLLDVGVDVNSRDFDDRTALHVAASDGNNEIVQLLIQRGADVDATDRWGSTPLADAFYYENHEICRILEDHGAKKPVNGYEASMRVMNPSQIPEYEINPKELDFSTTKEITKSISMAKWRGLNVAVKILKENYVNGNDQLNSFREELALLLKLRHPNVVQFLGAVTQSSPMMIVFEDLETALLECLKEKRSLSMQKILSFALDIARGMNYLHEHKPEVIIHRDLKPKNILLDGSGHLKVANFGLSKMLMVRRGEKIKMDGQLEYDGTSYRYMAPELHRHTEHDRSVDAFSFGIILQEMIVGHQPFEDKTPREAAEAYLQGKRPSFKPSSRHCPTEAKRLIESCWDDDPQKRPDFVSILKRLEDIRSSSMGNRLRKLFSLCFRC